MGFWPSRELRSGRGVISPNAVSYTHLDVYKRQAKNKHQQQFQASGKAINAKVRLYGRIGQALIDAKQSGRDPFAAIEAVMSWDAFAESVTEAQKLAQPEDFDFLHRIGESYATLRRYAPEFLAVLKLRAAPAAKDVLDAIEVLLSLIHI